MPVHMQKEKHVTLDVDSLQFDIYDAEDIRKISVCKITKTTSFDSLGNPVTGGLYDNAMGPSTRNEFCTTCSNPSTSCTGHFGHIELVMPCFNPFFMKTAASIMKAACLKCKRIQLTERMKEIVELQLKLIDAGYTTEAQDLEDQKIIFCHSSKWSSRGKGIDEKVGETKELSEKNYLKTMKRLRKLLANDPVNHYNRTKTSEAIRLAVVHSTMGEATGNMGRSKCLHCSVPVKRVRYSYKKLVLTLSKNELEELQGRNLERVEHNLMAKTKVIIANECREIMTEIFKNDGSILELLFPVLQRAKDKPYNVFFIDAMPVIPPVYRPPNHVRDILVEHPQTKAYNNIALANNQLRYILAVKRSIDGEENKFETAVQEEMENIYKLARGESANEKIYFKWEEMQNAVDMTLDKNASLSKFSDSTIGIKQLIEKKEGLIRMHMMGKRVNYAARTVITPDPLIEVDSIGVPEAFALKLTYPVPVTPWNVTELRKMVMNGPDKHPGACFIESTTGGKKIIPKEESKREAMSKTLLKPEPNNGMKIVHRHLINGDIMLLNRQPTLHRPSIMAHKARILKGEKTFKLHYSNCKSYNADFDGDEMNAHFPQNELGRSEAYNLVNVASHYLVPKDGTPLGGLIQDHMISGVKISMRGRFFNKEDYHQLVYQGLNNKVGNIKTLPPTIIKPIQLWSGKQIFSTLLLNIIPEGKPLINLKSTAKVGANLWQTTKKRKWSYGGSELKGNDMTEAEVVIRNGELLVGVLDKNHYGSTPYSLIHCMYDLYGGEVSTKLLSALTKVFTAFLQYEGFTLGVHDILVQKKADIKRKEIIEESRQIGKRVTCQALNISEDSSNEFLAEKLEEAYGTDPKFKALLDRKYKSAMDSYSNDINKTCLPAGLICKFPENNLQLMVSAGAKGSTVNTMQISCLLGQIELEGKRPPIMINGKALPSFPLFECSPKAGGFIHERFMTGIEPQGFLFHCMAGREGLIDTAVKTSRSGYLQRCLIKHLEGLTVAYDGTVRDSDKSVVQFMFGEDGMDILKSQFINAKQIQFLVDNKNAVANSEIINKLRNSPEVDEKIHKLKKKVKSYGKKYGSTLQRPIRGHNVKKCPSTVISQFLPHTHLGSLSESAESILDQYLKNNVCEDEDFVRNLFYVKNIKSLADPGEPVGLLAAQSIGEPSTQMTLNTFHFAGRGDMNVTLGIPRLREILMMASKNLKTPSMEIPFLNQTSDNLETIANKFRIRLNQVSMADVLKEVHVKTSLSLKSTSRTRKYELIFNFLPYRAYKKQFNVKPKRVIKYTHTVFLIKLFKFIEKASVDSGDYVETDEKESKKARKNSEDGDDEGQLKEVLDDLNEREADKSSDDENADDGDATANKRKMKQSDENDYDDPESEEERQGADTEDSDDELDLTKVKLEVDGDFDTSKFEQLVQTDENADLKQLNELENREEDQEEEEDANDNEIVQSVMRKVSAISSNIEIKDFEYDKRKHLWCIVKFEMPVKFKNIDMTNVLRDAARTSVIWEIPKLKRAITFKQNDLLYIKTEGINIQAMLQFDKILNLEKLYTNDIHAVAKIYGIEAAARVIVKEVQNVFKVYGITIDPRHLSLIADYMTFDGTFQPLNRKGIESSASPFQQVSFESALHFLRNAAVQGKMDDVSSPSSCLITGHPCKIGTGAFSLINDLSYALKN